MQLPFQKLKNLRKWKTTLFLFLKLLNLQHTISFISKKNIHRYISYSNHSIIHEKVPGTYSNYSRVISARVGGIELIEENTNFLATIEQLKDTQNSNSLIESTEESALYSQVMIG